MLGGNIHLKGQSFLELECLALGQDQDQCVDMQENHLGVDIRKNSPTNKICSKVEWTGMDRRESPHAEE